MIDKDKTTSDSPLDDATRARLAKLASMPVDLSRLRKAIEREMPEKASESSFSITHWLTPMRAVAASLLFLAVVASFLVLTATQPALASAENLVKIHQQTTSDATTVNSIDEANNYFASHVPANPKVPDMPDHKVMSCCTPRIGKTPFSCVSIQIEGKPITVAVARASDVQCPHCDTKDADGVTYCIQSQGKTNIVMMTVGDRWISVIGDIDGQRLYDIAKAIHAK